VLWLGCSHCSICLLISAASNTTHLPVLPLLEDGTAIAAGTSHQHPFRDKIRHSLLLARASDPSYARLLLEPVLALTQVPPVSFIHSIPRFEGRQIESMCSLFCTAVFQVCISGIWFSHACLGCHHIITHVAAGPSANYVIRDGDRMRL
jgi:hypothetical protein